MLRTIRRRRRLPPWFLSKSILRAVTASLPLQLSASLALVASPVEALLVADPLAVSRRGRSDLFQDRDWQNSA